MRARHHRQIYKCNIYRPQTKLREGNVFTGGCHFVGGGGVGTSYAPWDRSHGRVPLPHMGSRHLLLLPPDIILRYPHPPILLTSGGHHWRPIQT